MNPQKKEIKMFSLDQEKVLQAAVRMGLDEASAQYKEQIDEFKSAIHDMAKNIWRGDWNRLEQETRDVVEAVMKEKGERNE
jgi:hypothetical protein